MRIYEQINAYDNNLKILSVRLSGPRNYAVGRLLSATRNSAEASIMNINVSQTSVVETDILAKAVELTGFS